MVPAAAVLAGPRTTCWPGEQDTERNASVAVTRRIVLPAYRDLAAGPGPARARSLVGHGAAAAPRAG